MNRIRLFPLATLALALAFSASALSAQEAPPADGDRESVSVTVYNRGTALVQDRRTFTLNAGQTVINFTDVAASIDATSVSFRSLTDPEGTTVLEQNYVFDLVDASALLRRYIDREISITMNDGTEYTGVLLSSRNDIILRLADDQVVIARLNEVRDMRFPQLPDGLITRPTLRWLVSSETGGTQSVELTYLTGGMNWTADYNILLARDNSSLSLNGWVTLSNTSGTAYQDAQLKLIAGDVNRVSDVMFPMMMEMDMAVPSAAPRQQVEQRELFEYQLYELNRRVTIGDNETKQVEFVSGGNVPANTFYVYDASLPFYGYGSPIRDQYYGDTGITTVGTYLEFSTGEEDGLGADLPAGRVRVYQEDIDGAPLLIGENRISHTPKGEQIQLYLGNAFDLVGERVQTDYRFISSNVVQETYTISLRNRKSDTPVEIRVPERLIRWSNWEITSADAEYTRLNSNTIEFRVTVPPQGERTITYTVMYAFPR